MAKMPKTINQHKRLAMGDKCEQDKYACGGAVKMSKGGAYGKKPVAKKSGGRVCSK